MRLGNSKQPVQCHYGKGSNSGLANGPNLSYSAPAHPAFHNLARSAEFICRIFFFLLFHFLQLRKEGCGYGMEMQGTVTWGKGSFPNSVHLEFKNENPLYSDNGGITIFQVP